MALFLYGLIYNRSSRQEVFCKKGVLKILQNSQETPVPEPIF